MGRRPKLYVPLSVTFFSDERIIAAGDGATLLYLSMCLHAKALGSDGRLSELQIRRLHRPRWQVELHRLAELGLVLFDDESEDWFIASWFSHNESINAIEERRAADRKRKADSARNPAGIGSDSALKKSKEKRREVTESAHRYADDGSGACSVCSLPPANQVHLKLIEGSAS